MNINDGNALEGKQKNVIHPSILPGAALATLSLILFLMPLYSING